MFDRRPSVEMQQGHVPLLEFGNLKEKPVIIHSNSPTFEPPILDGDNNAAKQRKSKKQKKKT